MNNSLPKMNIDAPMLFIVVASPHEGLAGELARMLADNKQRLHEKFNGRPVAPWPGMVNHFPENTNKEEILASAEDILSTPKHYMMLLSGYKNNANWNEALKDLMSKNDFAAIFLSCDGTTLPDNLSKLFHADATIPVTPDEALEASWKAIRAGRHKSAVPLPKVTGQENKAPPRLLH